MEKNPQNNDLQITTQKTNDLAPWTPQKLGLSSGIGKKSLKIPKELSESINWSSTDNTMAKRKSTKGQTTIYKTYTLTKYGATRTSLKTGFKKLR